MRVNKNTIISLTLMHISTVMRNRFECKITVLIDENLISSAFNWNTHE
jgi:hypothetical protein